MATLADIRKAREAGRSIADDGGISIGEAFGAEPNRKHRRNKGTPHPAGPLGSLTTGAVNISHLPSWELRRRRAALKAQLATSEWEWEQNPTELGTAGLAALRFAICRLEQEMTSVSIPSDC